MTLPARNCEWLWQTDTEVFISWQQLTLERKVREMKVEHLLSTTHPYATFSNMWPCRCPAAPTSRLQSHHWHHRQDYHHHHDHHYHHHHHHHERWHDQDRHHDRHNGKQDADSPQPAFSGCAVPDVNGPWVAGEGIAVVVQRTLTAVCPEAEGPVLFKVVAATAEDSSLNIEVWPSWLLLRDGESETVTIRVTSTASTPLNVYQFGEVGSHYRSNID